MAKKKKRRQIPATPQAPEWRWLTFPVLVGFTVGAGAVVVLQSTLGLLGFLIGLYVVIALAGFALAHILTRFLGTWIIRRRAERIAREQRSPSPRPRTLPPV